MTIFDWYTSFIRLFGISIATFFFCCDISHTYIICCTLYALLFACKQWTSKLEYEFMIMFCCFLKSEKKQMYILYIFLKFAFQSLIFILLSLRHDFLFTHFFYHYVLILRAFSRGLLASSICDIFVLSHYISP